MGKKHEAVRLRFIASQVRFMAQRAASYGAAVLHKKTPDDEALFRFSSQYEAAPVFISLRRGKPFHYAMKHSTCTPYDYKMKNEGLFACNTYFFLLY